MDSSDKEPDIRRPNTKETRREDGKLHREEREALLQKVEELELQHRKKTLKKKIQEVKVMLEQLTMDESQQPMEHLQRVMETVKEPRIHTRDV